MQIEKPGYTKRELQLQWTNNIVQLHDLLCKCNKPLEHTIDNILHQEPNLRLEQSTKNLIEKCLTSGAADSITHEEDADIIGDGDLEKLFAEDFTEDDTG